MTDLALQHFTSKQVGFAVSSDSRWVTGPR